PPIGAARAEERTLSVPRLPATRVGAPAFLPGPRPCYDAPPSGGTVGFDDKLQAELLRIGKGGTEKYHQKNAEQGKLFAGARITDQIEMFPGRRGAGRIFYLQCQLSGLVPQLCLLFGPSAAGGAYIPAFCDLVVMVEKNASMYLGSPRMAEMVIGEKVSLEELGGARMHCSVSGCGDVLVKTEQEAIEVGRRFLSYLPGRFDYP